jgi:hypothetical protein
MAGLVNDMGCWGCSFSVFTTRQITCYCYRRNQILCTAGRLPFPRCTAGVTGSRVGRGRAQPPKPMSASASARGYDKLPTIPSHPMPGLRDGHAAMGGPWHTAGLASVRRLKNGRMQMQLVMTGLPQCTTWTYSVSTARACLTALHLIYSQNMTLHAEQHTCM